MKIYYKATKPDGFDFYSGTVDYAGALASGKPVARKPVTEFGFECCSDTVYHAADTAAETLVGCTWPCRLFEVTGRPVAREGHKFGFRSLRVLREVPAHLALGPNGEEAAALIDQASRLSPEQARQLAAAWGAARAAAWGAARDAAWGAARAAAWGAARDAAGDAARAAAWGAARDAAGGAAWGAGWGAARDAARDAAGVLVVRDLVSNDVFNTLYGPWASVMSPEASR